ncbi:MAG TPA: diacylglycerol kinase family protein [Panacibacter sp.]|nr:diacylglycerol kinase family protein [Panacibacter sp.]
MTETPALKLLFIINPGSGNNSTDWHTTIQNYFTSTPHTIELFYLSELCSIEKIKHKIVEYKPQRLIAVGGDGTVKLAAQCLMQTNIPLAILPAGSANGMAKELEIPGDAGQALDIVVNGLVKKIHLLKVNNEVCIHLSDIGFNAFVVKKSEANHKRGMWGYIKASWKVLWNKPLMQLEIQTDKAVLKRDAAMVVLANATKYGSGALINPNGKLNDGLFEVIIVKKVSFKEIFKMLITHMPYDPAKTEVLQTASLHIHAKKKVHFQVDGEYLGKINDITADIVTDAVSIIIPRRHINSFI